MSTRRFSANITSATGIALIQPPLPVQPLSMAVFMGCDPPYQTNMAMQQMEGLCAVLRAYGFVPMTIAEVLSVGVDFASPAFQTLEVLAQESITAEDSERKMQAHAALSKMAPSDLVEIIFQQPALILTIDPELSQISPDTAYEGYNLTPLFGLMFPRDHFIVTRAGIVLGCLKRLDRRRETRVVELALANLGFNPIYRCGNAELLEGGDYARTKSTSFVANGLRTNLKTVETLMTSNCFGTERVVVLTDGKRSSTNFHLDHYFGVASEEVVVVAEERLHDCNALTCVTYERVGGSYRTVHQNISLAQALSWLGMQCVSCSEAERALFATNLLALDDNVALIADSVPRTCRSHLTAAGVEVIPIPFSAFHTQHGSLHCAVQLLKQY